MRLGHVADAVRVERGLVGQRGLGHPGPEHSQHQVVVLDDRILREPVDPVCDPMERSPVDEHLDGVLVDAGVSGLLCGNEAVLLGCDIPQHRSGEGLGGHCRSTTIT